MAAYTYLTDDVIQRILRKPTRVSVPESYRLKEAKLILKNILARNLYSYAGEFTEADVIDVVSSMALSLSNKVFHFIFKSKLFSQIPTQIFSMIGVSTCAIASMFCLTLSANRTVMSEN